MAQLYPSIVLEEDLSPEIGEEIDGVCEEIRAATKGWGTDEDRLLKAMGGLTPEQRCVVPKRYAELYDEQDLKRLMKSECGNRDFGTALQYLATPPPDTECHIIDAACKGLGTNELLLGTIVCGRTNEEMELLKKTYFNIHTKDMGRVLDSELGGNYEQLIFNCLQGAEEAFDPEFHNEEKMKEDVATLYDMGQGKWFGTDEKGIFKILCASPPEYLAAVNQAYADEYGYTLYKAMEKELGGGDVGKATLFLLGMKLKPYETVAKLIHDAVKGFGTNELLLTATLIRYQSMLPQVAAAYEEEYGKQLEDVIKSETGGDYRKVLLEVLATGVAL